MFVIERTAIKLALAALVAASLFACGWTARGWNESKVALADLEEVFDAQKQTLDQLRNITNEAAESRRKQQAFHAEQKERLVAWLFAPGPADDCSIGDDGLSLWNAANEGRAAGPAERGIAGPMPASAAGSGRPGEDAGSEPPDGDGPSGRVCPAPCRAGGVGKGGD